MNAARKVVFTKLFVLLIIAVPNLVLPLHQQSPLHIGVCIGLVLLGGLILPLSVHYNILNIDRNLHAPLWPDNPLLSKHPMSIFHFLAWIFLIGGLSLVVSTEIHQLSPNSTGYYFLSAGAGLLTGVLLVANTEEA